MLQKRGHKNIHVHSIVLLLLLFGKLHKSVAALWPLYWIMLLKVRYWTSTRFWMSVLLVTRIVGIDPDVTLWLQLTPNYSILNVQYATHFARYYISGTSLCYTQVQYKKQTRIYQALSNFPGARAIWWQRCGSVISNWYFSVLFTIIVAGIDNVPNTNIFWANVLYT